MTGVGCIIIALQSAVVLGHAAPSSVAPALAALPANVASADPRTVALGLGALAISTLTPACVRKVVPAPLLALAVTTAAGIALFPGVAVVGAIPTGLPSFVVPELTASALTKLVPAAVTLAALGAIDSLLTSLVADSMTQVTRFCAWRPDGVSGGPDV